LLCFGGGEDMIFDPLHYLALLEQKTHALDQAAPPVGWELPEGFSQLRQLLEARLGKRGKREYVQVGGAFQPWTFGYIGRPSGGSSGLATLYDASLDYLESLICSQYAVKFANLG